MRDAEPLCTETIGLKDFARSRKRGTNFSGGTNNVLQDPFQCLHFARIYYAYACYRQAETKLTFFPTASLIRAMASVTTYSSNLNSDDRK